MRYLIQLLALGLLLFQQMLAIPSPGGDSPTRPRDITAVKQPHAQRFLSGNPLGGAFYENRGQIADGDGCAIDDIRYYAFYNGARVYFTPTGWRIVYGVAEDKEADVSEATGLAPRDNLGPEHCAEDEGDIPAMASYHVGMTLLGANADVEIEAMGKLTRYLNYYLGHCPEGITHVAAFNGLRYRNIYDNIDLVLYAAREGLKYEFEVRPGGCIEDIRMRHEGYDAMEELPDGSLDLRWTRGYTHEGVPFSYQQGEAGLREVPSSYRMVGEDVTFAVDGHDADLLLIIDPFSTYYGGSRGEFLTDLTCDSSNAVIATGTSRSADFPTRSAWQTSFPPPIYGLAQWTVFALKLSDSGAVQWATFIGGSRDQSGRGVAVDADENVVIVGYTSSPDFPVHNGFQMQKIGTGGSGFIFKLDSGGGRIWATYFHNIQNTGGVSLRGIAMDLDGNMYATGAGSTLSPVPVLRAHQPIPAGGMEMILLKMTSGGRLLFSSYLGGSDDEYPCWPAVDASGNLAIIGGTRSTDIPILNAFQTSRAGSQRNNDFFVAMYDSSGGQLWSTYLGGSRDEGWVTHKPAIAFNHVGELLVGGNSISSDFPLVNSLPLLHPYENNDATITRFSASGQVLWSSRFGGVSYDRTGGIVCDSIGNIYVAGETSSPDFPLLHPAYLGRPILNDAFIRKYDSTNTLLWSTVFGGNAPDAGVSIAVDRRGLLYVGGETESTDFPVYNAVQSSLPGLVSIFIHSFYTDGHIPVTLSRISAQRVSGGVELTWHSESEVNAHGYIIERRYEHGAPAAKQSWSDIGFVPSAAQGNEGREYTFLDLDPGTKDTRIYYRLRMIDLDGSFEHSPVVEVAPESGALAVSFEAAYPSPARDWLTLNFTLPVESGVSLSVHDVTGREIARVYDKQSIPGGSHSVVLPVGEWRSGLYLCTLTAGDVQLTRRVMVMR
jgi:hypothetical protein